MFILTERFLADASFIRIKTASPEQYSIWQVLQKNLMMNFEPLHVPYRYNEQDTPENKVVYALGQLAEADAQEIVEKLKKANPDETITVTEAEIILKNYFDQGLIKGEESEKNMRYNLSKILKPNSGRTNVDNLDKEL